MTILNPFCRLLLLLMVVFAGIVAGLCYGCSWLFGQLGDLFLAARARIYAAVEAFEKAFDEAGR